MGRADILSINVGKPKQIRFKHRDVSTGIFKTPAEEPVFLSWANFDGDGQADLVHHGGREKAVCVYPYEHYPFWENELQRKLEFGALGENITIRGLLETDVHIGDVFQLGEAIVQVSQPRQPCYKLTVRYGVPDMLLKVQDTGFMGFYFRVLKEGHVCKTDGLKRISRHPKAVTISYANRMKHHEKDNIDGIKKLLEVEELSENWRASFLKRLDGIEPDHQERLTGNL
ncbi:MOSC domain-containing protein [Bacillus glycinifermentans]|uniref:MOSC domain-containing protein n=1 Tax=Bacillus glycinifermentans TaxID=1664069 RepID=UPI001FF3BC3E|nr:MOSC domain-containing protein [Bacillus glycinifermentans]MEC3607585.1 MOSC domain-containing protein [Bacillus glycinifermentans]UOY90669.1 MOSC domain-containing protein [Bacillus glycinifermentans]